VNAVSLPLEAGARQIAAGRYSRLRRAAREPLLHFALIGLAIFAADHYLELRRQAAQTSIVVDSGLRQRLANLYRSQFGVAANSAQLQIILDDYVDDEVQYREARRIGLDQDDEIIRRRLIQKLEFLQRDAVAARTPSNAELHAYYDAHREQFSVGPRVSFSQAFFNPDRGGDARALARARQAHEQWLTGGAIPEGDAGPLESGYSALTREQVTRLFGTGDFVTQVFAQAPGEWSEPVRSGFGWHLLQVMATEPARLLPFDGVMPEVRAACLTEAATRDRRQRLDALRARYQVESRSTTP
jgi:peptidyl-prolyl cis-trans isomerase C